MIEGKGLTMRFGNNTALDGVDVLSLIHILITREPGSGTRTILEKHLELQNLTLGDFRQVMEISSLEALKSLAMEGCGVTFLYQAAVRCELADGRLREIELEDFRYRHDFTFLWRKNSVFPAWYHRLFHELGGVEAEQ